MHMREAAYEAAHSLKDARTLHAAAGSASLRQHYARRARAIVPHL